MTPVTAPSPVPGGVIAPVVTKPTLAFKGKVKVTNSGQLSVACVVTAAPKGATCRLRIIAGAGSVLARVQVPVTGDSARLRVKLSKKQLKQVPKSRKVRAALDLVGADGAVILTTRQSVKLPKR